MKTVMHARELGAVAYVLKHAPRAEVLQMLSDAFDSIAEADSEGGAPGAPPGPPA